MFGCLDDKTMMCMVHGTVRGTDINLRLLFIHIQYTCLLSSVYTAKHIWYIFVVNIKMQFGNFGFSFHVNQP